MALEKIRIHENDKLFIMDAGDKIKGCGTINDDGNLYFIDTVKMEALKLPEEFKYTPICLIPPCGGYQDGLIMVSLLGEIDLQYHHNLSAAAGIWGWIDLDGNEIIRPQYLFATSFYHDRAIVCKGKWTVNSEDEYWCENENWGIIDKTGQEVIPCEFDEISSIDNSDDYILCHKGGWKAGKYLVYDINNHKDLFELGFDFDSGYMFNECFYEEDRIFFDEHIPGEETDYISVYSIGEEKFITYREKYEKRKLNGQSKIIINKDGKDIIVF